MTGDELFDIEERVAQLPPEAQMRLIERLIHRVRQTCFTDHAALERGLQEMATDPDIQRELRQINQEFEGTEADGLDNV